MQKTKPTKAKGERKSTAKLRSPRKPPTVRLETAVVPWRFLVRRRHPWRKQLSIKGRNLTARQLVGAILANRFDEKAAAANYHLPLAAIREAITYVEHNAHLLATEAEIERLMGNRKGVPHVAQPVS